MENSGPFYRWCHKQSTFTTSRKHFDFVIAKWLYAYLEFCAVFQSCTCFHLEEIEGYFILVWCTKNSRKVAWLITLALELIFSPAKGVCFSGSVSNTRDKMLQRILSEKEKNTRRKKIHQIIVILTSNSMSNSYFRRLWTYQHFPNHLQKKSMFNLLTGNHTQMYEGTILW